jgi:hypothetical protein
MKSVLSRDDNVRIALPDILAARKGKVPTESCRSVAYVPVYHLKEKTEGSLLWGGGERIWGSETGAAGHRPSNSRKRPLRASGLRREASRPRKPPVPRPWPR